MGAMAAWKAGEGMDGTGAINAGVVNITSPHQ